MELPLTTSRLRIERLVADDATALAGYRNDERVARWQSWSRPYSLERAQAAITAMADDTPGQPGHGVNLALRENDALVGDLYVHVLAEAAHTADLGITLAPHAQGRGLATEAVTAVVDALFGDGEVVKAIAYVDPRNEPSLALFDRLGFRREGYLSQSFREADGSYADEVLFGLTADVWRHLVPEPVVTTHPHPADVALMSERIYEFNVAATGIGDGQEWAAFVRDDLGRVVGGITGTLWGAGAAVNVLWVAEERRGAGLGTRLLVAAEEHARRNGGRNMFLSTHTFQAPGFYERLGYQRSGAWDDYPRGHGDVFFHKRLG
jgi:RimJ/RimL family protein N-acetyltransferase